MDRVFQSSFLKLSDHRSLRGRKVPLLQPKSS